MHNSHEMIAWDHTAAICAAIINMHRDPKKSKSVDIRKLNPYRSGSTEKPKIRLNSKDSMKLLKRVFIDHQPPSLTEIAAGKI